MIDANNNITPKKPNSKPLNGRTATSPLKPITDNNPKAHDGHAGAIKPTMIPEDPVIIPPFICLLIKKILMAIMIPANMLDKMIKTSAAGAGTL